ncbi:type II toxin-antitoxin system VapC family toxin [Kaistia geumhonensis]|uniref:PIN domain nuclease of toxin-antitoxin system n=1 Tax=Kaistia geumhonensis TaxID=410839 RepID=A0ABU0M501_9HYPH|nr:type II toxin-antitoxin system VapC family toxin [Kaistia geumhonensis]MCX5478888.1 type II toxin-antitoxin system VapC family toxin [Kaistia geumhonensis]MDQ0515893.1 PIN domain nuclease of toxin-antitoxin system [Kaistia geumhonensis]
MHLLLDTHEIALKFRRGLWPETEQIASEFEGVCDRAGFVSLPISARHAAAAGVLPLDHRDPFDRILAAEAIAEDMSIISIDEKLDLFPMKRLWA